MKKFLLTGSMICVFGTCMPMAWASDAVSHPATPAHTHTHTDGVYSVQEPYSSPHLESHRLQIQSSIQVNRDVLQEAYMASREAYTKKLEKYAKITSRDAQKEISAAHPKMNVENVQLRNIKTSLVYIGLATSDSDKYLVIVDAGNGNVLLDRELPTHHTRVFSNH